MNALIAGLSITQEQVPVNRGTLDFLISHMPINSPINSIQENIRLVECATLAYTKKDFATLNKISNWLFSHIDEDEEEIDAKDPTIITIVESQKNLFR
jgi:Dopey, N-terminal